MTDQNPETATTEVAPAHRFDEQRLYSYLKGRIADVGSRLEVRQFQGGTSNPTFLLSTDGAQGPRRYVLRKKPPGTLLASAHQVDREHRIMKALEGKVPVPHMQHLCEDPEVIGAAFYVMDFLDGRIFRDAGLPGLPRAEQAEIYDQLNLTLAKLHQVDFNALGLSDYGRPGNYFERQVKRWTKQYRDAETEVIPEMETLIATLPKLIPADESISIAHGDYRLENTMFDRASPRLIAVLDWELSTIGHPLADIAYNCFLWHSRRSSWGTLQGVDFATSGIPTEQAYLEAYCRRTGRSGVEHWNFYLAFAIFRLAAIGQGVYRRILAGIAASDRKAENNAAELSRQALAILQR